jgi:hypothetical protein
MTKFGMFLSFPFPFQCAHIHICTLGLILLSGIYPFLNLAVPVYRRGSHSQFFLVRLY